MTDKAKTFDKWRMGYEKLLTQRAKSNYNIKTLQPLEDYAEQKLLRFEDAQQEIQNHMQHFIKQKNFHEQIEKKQEKLIENLEKKLDAVQGLLKDGLFDNFPWEEEEIEMWEMMIDREWLGELKGKVEEEKNVCD